MRRKILIIGGVALAAVILIPAIFLMRVEKQERETADEITVTFSEQGFRQRVTEVKIDGYAVGMEVQYTYLLVNETGYDIMPTIFCNFKCNPDDYSLIEGQGYVAVPDYYQDWIDVPAMGMITDGESKAYTIKIKIPSGTTEEIPERWAFQTVASSNTGGMYQVAPAVWLLVNMR